MAEPIKTAHGPLTASEIRDRLLAQAAENDDFRARLLADPKAVLRDDYDIAVPESMKVFVHEEDATTAHLVLPRSKRLTEAEMATASGAYY